MTRPVSETHLSASHLNFLLVTLGLVVLPHLGHLHWSHSGLFLSFWIWRFLGIRWTAILPRSVWLPLLTLFAATVVVISRHGAIDLITSTGLFVTGLGLKLMELKNLRDVYVTVFLGWFVALTQFLYDQSLLMAGYGLLSSAALTVVLIQINNPRPLGLRPLVDTVLGLMVPALPVAVVLFLFFPRLSGPFIRLPFDTHAQTGLSEVMEPGAVAHLATSSAVAFRVDFDGEPPPPEERYWRAQVFWYFDGTRWLPQVDTHQPLVKPFAGTGQIWRYHVTIEPHHHHWLFSLGIPANIPAGARLSRAGTLQVSEPVGERLHYALSSFSHYRFPPLSEDERRWGLQLPGPPTPRVRRLVAQLQQKSETSAQLAAAILQYFRTQNFVYTLHPPLLGGSPVDQFLFETREGFCEHYASASVYLLRVAGVPARIVGGYLGGFLNPKGGFLEIYQANAHAWAEFWDGTAWVRYDPTQAVAPDYVEYTRNLPEPVISGTPSPLSGFGTTFVDTAREIAGSSWWRRMRRNSHIFWSALDHRWHLWVLGYGRQQQTELFRNLLGFWPYLCLVAVVFLVWLILFFHRSQARDPLSQADDKFLSRLQSRDLVRAPCETPLAFAGRAVAKYPEQAATIQEITIVYIEARYGRLSSITASKRLQDLISRL